MATVVLTNDNIKVKAPAGTSLRTIATKTGASMEFGCRVGDCTTCVARIESGMDHLSAKNEKEVKALEMFGSKVDDLRLMCQCTVNDEEGEIVISYGM